MSPESVREALARHEPKTTPFEAHPDRAAVAIVLAGEGNQHARQFFAVARKVAERALAQAAKDENILEIT